MAPCNLKERIGQDAPIIGASNTPPTGLLTHFLPDGPDHQRLRQSQNHTLALLFGLGARIFFFSALKLWNSLPATVRTASSIPTVYFPI